MNPWGRASRFDQKSTKPEVTYNKFGSGPKGRYWVKMRSLCPVIRSWIRFLYFVEYPLHSAKKFNKHHVGYHLVGVDAILHKNILLSKMK